MRRLPLALALLACPTLLWPWAFPHDPLFIWNATASFPVGLYRIVPGAPRRASIAVIRLPEPIRQLARDRAYLPASALLIKPIVALRGDVVCRWGNVVSINGRATAFARNFDGVGRPLPRWRGCHRLQTRLFVIAGKPDSFDSRYFGPIERGQVVGLVAPVIVLRP